jgi:hypothetical protein
MRTTSHHRGRARTRRDESESAYTAIVRAGIPTDHHESDLYVLDTPEARRILAEHGRAYSRFISATDRRYWLDVPFAYAPFWTKKTRVVLHRPGLAKARLRDAKKKPAYAWQLWSTGNGEEPQFIESFKDKGDAQRRMRRLQDSQRRAGMKPYHYTLKHRPVPARRLFGKKARLERDSSSSNKRYRVVWVRDDKRTSGVMAAGPFTHKEATTVVSKITKYPWRRVVIQEIPSSSSDPRDRGWWKHPRLHKKAAKGGWERRRATAKRKTSGRRDPTRVVYISRSQNLAALIDNAYGHLTSKQASGLMRAIDEAEREGEDPRKAAVSYLHGIGVTVHTTNGK